MTSVGEPNSTAVRLLRRHDVSTCFSPQEVIDAVREALVAVARRRVIAPAPMAFEFRAARGEAHVKGAYLEGTSDWAVKVATGFYENHVLGLPAPSGLSLVCSARTGLVHTVIADGGHLTDVRTGAAGALAAAALTPPRIRRVAIVGTGLQARMQLEYLLQVRQIGEVVAFGRHRERANAYAAEMHARFGVRAKVAAGVREAVGESQLVITATPSEQPLVRADWVERPTALVAVGSDMPAKQELETALLEQADLLVADDPARRCGSGSYTTRPRRPRAPDGLASCSSIPPPKPLKACASQTSPGSEPRTRPSPAWWHAARASSASAS